MSKPPGKKKFNLLSIGVFSYPIRLVSYTFAILVMYLFYQKDQIPVFTQIIMVTATIVPHLGFAAYWLGQKKRENILFFYMVDSCLAGTFIASIHGSYEASSVITIAVITSSLALSGVRFSLMGLGLMILCFLLSNLVLGFHIDFSSPQLLSRVSAGYLAVHVVIFGIASYYFTQNTTRTKNQIARQNNLIVEQNEKMISQKEEFENRIKYARNIQEMMLPTEKYMKTIFQEFFVYYVPKEVVSGDFYWAKKEDDVIYVACVDCTGHGVPGAFMSMISYQLLDEIIGKHRLTNPAYIFEELNREIQVRLKQKKSDNNDGLAISLCKFDLKTRQLTVGGSYHSVLLFNNGVWQEVKTTRKQIGGNFVNKLRSFTNHEFTLGPDAIVYMYSDGMGDQFGGPNSEKLTRKKMFAKIMEMANDSMTSQNISIMNFMEEWMGAQDQTDDMTLIGMKV